jgi:hypothetical protein
MKIALPTVIVALLLIPALVWAQPTPKPCSRIDDPGTNKGHILARLTRTANGATLSFQMRTVPPGGAEEFIGVCAAQGWQPNPTQFDLTNDELAHLGTAHKSLALTMPNGNNGCVGTGTALLNGK